MTECEFNTNKKDPHLNHRISSKKFCLARSGNTTLRQRKKNCHEFINVAFKKRPIAVACLKMPQSANTYFTYFNVPIKALRQNLDMLSPNKFFRH